ncbi:MAG: hypothetical protein HYU66_01685 [Armatimonadetes bacterium]|nr:hypothetical protein [Armatimonadota bacterium]
MASSRRVSFALIGAFVVGGSGAFLGCGGHSGLPGPTRTLTGVVNEPTFTVGANERVECVGDVTVNCGTADVAGRLFSRAQTQPGADGSSITINATGDVNVSGRIETGSGVNGGANGVGGDGGDATIASSGGSVTLGTAPGTSRRRQDEPGGLHAGNGGDGGDGTLGGAGGAGGSIRLAAANGTLTIHQSPGLVQVGNGGDGGRGVVGGQDLLTFTPPATLPNGGGDSGGVSAAWGTVVGAEVAEDPAATPPKVILLDEGVATGGDGGDAGAFYLGVDPVTDASTWPAQARAAGRAVPAAVEVVGSDGGEGWWTGGQGSSVNVSYAGAALPAGTAGTEVTATGGKGGDAVAGALDLILGGGMRGGNGGAANAAGGHGAAGDGCGAVGGTGGKATAVGGEGGRARVFDSSKDNWFPGNGGAAAARGGQGGSGGACCNPPGPAGLGGGGGDANARGGDGGSAFPRDAQRQGAGGDATAVAGNGGGGGDGSPPGTGGGGGQAVATAGQSERLPGTVKQQQDGANGGGGVDCTPPPQGTRFDVLVKAGGTDIDSYTLKLLSSFFQIQDGRQAPTVLGGPINQLDPRAFCTNRSGTRLYIARIQSPLWVYSDFQTGGDRAPSFMLSLDGTDAGPGNFTNVALDEQQDVLYAVDFRQLCAWDSISTTQANRPPDRILAVPDDQHGAIEQLVAGGSRNLLFLTRSQTNGPADLFVFTGVSTANGDVAPAHTVTGLAGSGGQIRALAYDDQRDILYAGRWFGVNQGAVAVVTDASTAEGDLTGRVVTGTNTQLTSIPSSLAVFPDLDLLFAGVASGPINAYRNASTLDGNVTPDQSSSSLALLSRMAVWQSP